MIRKKSFFLWLLLFVFLTTYNFDFKKEIKKFPLTIKKIKIEGLKNSNEDKILNSLEIFKGRNIIFFSTNDLNQVIIESEFIKEFKIQKIYPDTIKVTAIEFKPLAIFVQKNKKYIITDGGKKIENYDAEMTNLLPFVYGKNADINFYDFYSVLNNTGFKIDKIKQFNYFHINRWDIILKNDKTLKLPSKNYEKAIMKFLEIYEQKNFINFKLFDFRVNEQLILK